MDLTVKQQSQKILILNIIKKLESRGMEGYYFDSARPPIMFKTWCPRILP